MLASSTDISDALGGTVVELVSETNGTSTTTTALSDHYKDGTGNYTSRVKPLVDALAAIAGRLAGNRPTATPGITGTVPR